MKEEVLAGSALAILSPPVVRGSQANSKISVGLIGSGGRGSYDAAIARVPFARGDGHIALTAAGKQSTS
jgi:hypothetical protein